MQPKIGTRKQANNAKKHPKKRKKIMGPQ